MFTGNYNPDGSAERKPRSQTPMRRLVIDSNGTKEIVVDCKLGTALAPGAVIDTGAGRSGISASYWRRNRAHFEPLNKKAARNIGIEPVSGNVISPLGIINAPITFCDAESGKNYHLPSHPFLVLENMNTDVLIGMDLMQPKTAIQHIEVASGKIKYSSHLRTTKYTPVSDSLVCFPIRLVEALNLRPGETRPVRLMINADEEQRTGMSLLIRPAAMVADDGTRFVLSIPDQLRTLEDKSRRTFVTTVSNPTRKPLHFLRNIVVAQGTQVDDTLVAPLKRIPDAPPMPSYAVRRLPVTTARKRVNHEKAQLSPAAKKAWLDFELEKLVGLLTDESKRLKVGRNTEVKRATNIKFRTMRERHSEDPEEPHHDVRTDGITNVEMPSALPHEEQH